MFNNPFPFETALDFQAAYLDLGDDDIFDRPPLLGKRQFSLFQDEPTDLRSHIHQKYEGLQVMGEDSSNLKISENFSYEVMNCEFIGSTLNESNEQQLTPEFMASYCQDYEEASVNLSEQYEPSVTTQEIPSNEEVKAEAPSKKGKSSQSTKKRETKQNAKSKKVASSDQKKNSSGSAQKTKATKGSSSDPTNTVKVLSSSSQALPKLKLDQGFKSVLRGLRKALKAIFENSGLSKGKHHWNESRWISQVEQFLNTALAIRDPTDQEVAAVVLMLYPSFGPSHMKEVDEESFIFQALGEQGMKIYKSIFDNNNKALRAEFFNDRFIRKIWSKLMQALLYQHCFSSQPVEDLTPTYRKITSILEDEFNLKVAVWYKTMFPKA